MNRARGRFGRVRAVAVALLVAMATGRASANPQDFSGWLDGLRAEARASGIAEATITVALAGITPLPRVIELDRNQPESTLRFEEYMVRVVSEKRVETGRALMAENARSEERRVGKECRL